MKTTKKINNDKEQLCSHLQQTVCYSSMTQPSGASDAASAHTPAATARYTVADILGSGGMGVVLKVFDNNLHRNVAMKVLQKEHVERGESAHRFIREAEITGALEHPNIVPLHELGIDLGDNLYYTMKEIQGETLQHILKRLKAQDPDYLKAYPLSRLIEVILKVCHAISLAHSHHVVHRDIKPANIMVGSFGEVLVVDWGLAKRLTTESTPSEASEEDSPDVADPPFVTQAGAIMGTPGYMSPEQILARQHLNERTDIFAIGGLLYAILTLRPPITGSNAREVIANTIKNPVESPSDYLASLSPKAFPKHLPWKRVPASLDAVVVKALERQASDRYQTVQELIEDLKRYQEGYATAAESASLARQFILLFARSRKIMSAVMLVFLGLIAYSTAFSWKLMTEIQYAEKEEAFATDRKKEADENTLSAQKQLERVKKHVPDLVDHARFELKNQNVIQALKLIERALFLEPNTPAYHELKGDILCNLLRFEEASGSYELAVQYNGGKAALSKLEMTQKLSSYSAFDHQQKIRDFHRFLTTSARHHEALNILRHMGEDRKKALSSTLAVVGESYEHFTLAEGSDYRYGHKLRVPKSELQLEVAKEQTHFDLSLLQHVDVRDIRIHNPDVVRGWEYLKLQDYYFRVQVHNTPVFDFKILEDLKIGQLDLAVDDVRNASLINGLNAREYIFAKCSAPCISAMNQQHIEWLSASGLADGDLKAFNNIKAIDRLTIEDSSFDELTDLGDIEVGRLELSNCSVDDLQYKGSGKLKKLTIRSKDVFSLDGVDLKNCESLNLSGSKVNDLRPLAEHSSDQLTKLYLEGCWVNDLNPLKKHKLTVLNIANTPVESLAPLRGMPLKELSILHTRVSDLTPIAECPLQTIYFDADTITKGLDALRTNKTLRTINGVNTASFWYKWNNKVLGTE